MLIAGMISHSNPPGVLWILDLAFFWGSGTETTPKQAKSKSYLDFYLAIADGVSHFSAFIRFRVAILW